MSLYKLMLNTDLRDLIDEISEQKKKNLEDYERCEEAKRIKAYFVGIDRGYEKVIEMIEERIKR